jgi:phage tail-like protein
MDVNGSRYFLLRTEAEFDNASTRLQWHPLRQALTLSQNQELRLPASQPEQAMEAWRVATPMAMDPFGQIARLSADRRGVIYNSGRGDMPLEDGELDKVAPPAGCQYLDMDLNSAGLLALTWSDGENRHGLTLFHLVRRWRSDCALSSPAHRVWLDDNNRAWCLAATELLVCQGEPLPLPYHPDETRFEPVTINPGQLSPVQTLPLPPLRQALAICGNEDTLYLLAGQEDNHQTIFTRPLSLDTDIHWIAYPVDDAAPFAIDLALTTGSRLAALAPQQPDDPDFVRRDCPVLALHKGADEGQHQARLVRERYPMLSLAQPRFVSSGDGQLRYQAEAGTDYPETPIRPRELHPLRQVRFHRESSALLSNTLDSGNPDTQWHRVYLDACIPSGCSLRLSVRVYDHPDDRTSAPLLEQPVPTWNPLPSELPFAGSLAGHEPGHRGLFELLLQAPDGEVRELRGRYLQMQVHFTGTMRQTPALHALRVYYPRFSYQQRYFPELYQQEKRRPDGEPAGPANGADVRERLLANFEGMLTPLEGRIAASDQLVHPDSAPSQHLHWMAGAIGAELPAHWPEARQRRWLKHATLLQQYKGTLAATNLALDIACDGAVTRGEVVLVENFRLRRTMATILGRHMDDRDHPLTLGTGMSGNSIIGDSLILADIDAREFLALFAPELADAEESEAVEAFFEQYAHKVSVVLNGPGIKLRSRVSEMLVDAMPAHIQWQFVESEQPFVLGTAPLLTIDTFMENRPAVRPVELDNTWLGQEGVLRNPAAFSPSDVNART